MSTTKNSLAKVGGVEIMTGINTVGIIYFYYELNKLGADVNKRIGTISGIIKKLNNNINVINQHFMKHLYHHRTVLDVDDQSSTSDMLENHNILTVNEEILARLKELDDRVAELEAVRSPLFIEKSIENKFPNSSPKQTNNGKNTERIF